MAENLTARIQAMPGDVIIMTEGAGGGTISTTALYYGMHDIVDETINLKFIDACEALFDAVLVQKIHAMTDVTNGGVRGDAKEIARTAKVKLIFEEEKLRKLVNKNVLEMLDKLEIDYLGVSLDALLIIAPPEYAQNIIESVQKKGVAIDVVGNVVAGEGAELIVDGKTQDFTPRFRESAYTPIKKLVGEKTPRNFDLMKQAVDNAAAEAIEKKKRMVRRIKGELGCN
jgi:hydrogenase expression/formation protein